MTRTVLLAALLFGTATQAEEPAVTYQVSDSFENVAFAVENAIIGAGLVIDHVSHTGEMLERTRGDVGSNRVIFSAADIFSFCSAEISRQVMEADIANIAYCPYGIFVYETPDLPGTITVGHRAYSGSMAPVQSLMTSILSDALGFP